MTARVAGIWLLVVVCWVLRVCRCHRFQFGLPSKFVLIDFPRILLAGVQVSARQSWMTVIYKCVLAMWSLGQRQQRIQRDWAALPRCNQVLSMRLKLRTSRRAPVPQWQLRRSRLQLRRSRPRAQKLAEPCRRSSSFGLTLKLLLCGRRSSPGLTPKFLPCGRRSALPVHYPHALPPHFFPWSHT